MHCEITRHNRSANCECWEPIPILAWDADVRVNDFFPVPRACLAQGPGCICVLRSHHGEADGRDRFEATGWRGCSSHSIIGWYISELDGD